MEAPLDPLDYICTISGAPAQTAELVNDAPDDDPLDDCPLGWIRVTVARRLINPAWLELQKRKARLVAATHAQMPLESFASPEEHHEAMQDVAFSFQANFAFLEAATPKYVAHEEEVLVSDPHNTPAVAEAWTQIAETLDVTVGVPATSDAEEEEAG